MQVFHYDFDLSNRNKDKDAMPYSALTAVDGDATSITLVLEIRKGVFQELVVPLLPGDMVLWSGEILHGGRPYALPNMRMFTYFPTKKHMAEDSVTVEDVNIIA
jgi:hypothetical protein